MSLSKYESFRLGMNEYVVSVFSAVLCLREGVVLMKLGRPNYDC